MAEETVGILPEIQEEFISPYKLAKLESDVRGVSIPPQKLYGYVRQGYVKATVNSTGKLAITRESALEYLSKFVK